MDNKAKILAMLAEGKIDVTEAEKLLNAVDAKERWSKKDFPTSQQFFNILVDSKKEGGTRVKIKVPFRLIRAGMKFVKLIPEQSRNKIQGAMRDKGIDFDLNDINTLNDDLLEALQTLEVSVDDSETSESVRIFCG